MSIWPPHAQFRLEMSGPGDPSEREADGIADAVMRSIGGAVVTGNHDSVQRASDASSADGGRPAWESGEVVMRSRSDGPRGDEGTRVTPSEGDGRSMAPSLRTLFEPRFDRDFSQVRVHTGAWAERAARYVGALAYTLGTDIVFGAGRYQPHSVDGQRLVAHELAHVVQQGGSQKPMRQAAPTSTEEELERRDEGIEVGAGHSAHRIEVVQRNGQRVARDLAIPPTVPGAPEPLLTDVQVQQAIRYNDFRFKDPYSIAVVRDLVGVPRFPAVSDEDLARAVARYQADFGLTPDGQAGPATTRRLTAELRAEDLPEDARQLRADNFVTWAPAAGTHNPCAAPPDAGGLATFFQWDVNFSTSLRDGWLIQEIVNARTRTRCPAGAIPETLTPRYWEAWWVDGSGNARVPTVINAARTRATSHVAPVPAHDLWRRAAAAPSVGNMSISARIFTTLRLPAGFVAGGVPDALALPATAAAPGGDELGLAVAARRATAQWNCCPPAATQFHTP